MAASNPVISEGAVIEEFLSAMRGWELEIDEPIIADGKRHRYHHVEDPRRVKNVWAVLHIDDRPAGTFACWKRHPEAIPWKMQGMRPLTQNERDDLRRTAQLRAEQRAKELTIQHAEAAKRAEAWYEAAAEVTSHPYLQAKGVPSNHKLRIGNWYYLDEETGEERLGASDALIVPFMDTAKRIHTLQGIMLDKEGRFIKRYMQEGDKAGHFLSIGSPRDNTILICEGLATGLSLWKCTGHAVIITGDTSGLEPAARAIRGVFPEHRLLFCADNDQWTLDHRGNPKNPGVEYANGVSIAVAGEVAIPEFLDVSSKPTDFNDLHQLEGEDAVRTAIEAALTTPTVSTAPVTPVLLDEILPPDDPEPPEDGPAINKYFAILGHDHDKYFFFQFEKRQVLTYTCSQMHEAGFIQLASISWWESTFRSVSKPGTMDKKQAMEFLMRAANKRGVFTPDNLRGRGAWIDEGRQVYHHGQNLTVDGKHTEVTGLRSVFVYEVGQRIQPPAETALTNAEGFKLLNLAAEFRWSMRGSAALLCGWVILAPLCGALDWRPHIWLTGNAGGGKSTILNYFIAGLLRGGMAVFAQGNSTEPGIRQRLQCDALPLVMDESEQNEEKDVARIQSILSLMRQASTESQAQTFKGTTTGEAQYFHIRSMFCLASIQVGLKNQADIERISVLTLKPKMTGPLAAEQWEGLRDRMHMLITRDKTISARLFRRSLDQLPTILKNIETFKSVAARMFKSQRAGDQYGTLLAGCFALVSQKEATVQDAEFLINSYDWVDQIDDTESDEAQKALAALLEAHIRAPGGLDLSVYEVLSAGAGIPREGVELEPSMARALLGRYGMKIGANHLYLANGSNELKSLMSHTQFKTDWRGMLLRLPNADRNDNMPIRMNGANVKVTRIELSNIFKGDSRQQMIAIDDDEPAPF